MLKQHAEPCIRRRALVLSGIAGAGALAIGWGLSGCGGAAAALVVPYFTFQFNGVPTVGGSKVLVFAQFSPDEASRDKPSGRFDPNNTGLTFSDPVTGTKTASGHVNGTFDQRTMHLVLTAATPPLAPAYDGLFVADDTIRLTPVPAGAATPELTLVRVDNSFRPDLFGVDWVGTDGSGRSRTLRLQSIQKPDNFGVPSDVFSAFDATVLFTGTDHIVGLSDGKVTGWANMRQIELTITQGADTRTVSGHLTPSGTTPPAEPPTHDRASGIELDDGSRLRRGP